jgi:hypothetical protein
MATDRAPLVGITLCLGAIGVLVLLMVRPLPWGSPRDETLPACPSVVLGPSRVAPEVPRSAVDCLFGARADREGAELQVTSYTDEGDPVRTYYRRSPGEPGLVVMTDQRADRYGTGGWSVAVCPEATSPHALGFCADRG